MLKGSSLQLFFLKRIFFKQVVFFHQVVLDRSRFFKVFLFQNRCFLNKFFWYPFLHVFL